MSTAEPYLETRLDTLAAFSISHEAENERFQAFLKKSDAAAVDSLVAKLDAAITPRIDCTACGNCCKSLMIVVTDEEATALATHLSQTREQFDVNYIEKGSNGMMIVNRMPCHFLSNQRCTVYEHRFAGCREFPALHVPQFTRRLFTTFMHYNRCPIIFNVMEQLKTEMAFPR